jgi:hypothetical protein
VRQSAMLLSSWGAVPCSWHIEARTYVNGELRAAPAQSDGAVCGAPTGSIG